MHLLSSTRYTLHVPVNPQHISLSIDIIKNSFHQNLLKFWFHYLSSILSQAKCPPVTTKEINWQTLRLASLYLLTSSI